MLGAIAGDIIGSAYEWDRTKQKDFELFRPHSAFTDDSVMTCAVAEAILSGRPHGDVLHEYGRRFPGRGYGGMFVEWLRSERPKPYGSFGNGAGMRASPAGYAAATIEETLDLARQSAVPTHDHPEGVKGAQAIATAVFMAKRGEDKKAILDFVREKFGYDLDRRIDAIRSGYRFDETCHRSVPEAILCFAESENFESAIRLAVSLGGDADTLACMAGGIALAYYREMPGEIHRRTQEKLDPVLWNVVERFHARYRFDFELI